MVFDWKSYLDLAELLKAWGNSNPQKEDECFRSATSRAYYAAFCYSRNYARDKDDFRPTNKPKDHRLLIEHYKAKNVKISGWLGQLRKWRNDCDYDDVVDNLNHIADGSITIANKVFNEL